MSYFHLEIGSDFGVLNATILIGQHASDKI